MKRTILLVIVLLIIASLLLFYAVSINPTKKTISLPSPTMTKSINPTKSPAETTLFIIPESKFVKDNETINLDVQIDTGINKITGIQLEIAYDPKILTNVKISKGTFLPNSNILLNIIDSDTGRISYALVIPPSVTALSGKGTVAVITATKNIEASVLSESEIKILPKSLVTQVGTEGSVLKNTKSALLNFSSSTSANITYPPTNNLPISPTQ